ncbi:DUF4190 domain-containing protein [Mycobacterium tuberculosis]|nr:DUF4190 domain-containing protein [Mycobacterium tuberculosis]MCE3299430.1 DUF4190 domain-containing protein [Mycobacterium tuberculosis]
MTAPSGSSGESAHDAAGGPPPVGERPPEQPIADAPWAPPASSPMANHPPPAYPPSGYPPAYQPGYPTGYPPPMPPGGYAPPGYPPPGTSSAGYGDIPYPPMPPPYGGSPGGYYPEPGYLDGYGPSQPGMNTMALVSLISALVGVLCCIGSIVGIAFGAIAINQIKQTREEGYGLAVAGIVIGIATLLVYMIAGIFAIP